MIRATLRRWDSTLPETLVFEDEYECLRWVHQNCDSYAVRAHTFAAGTSIFRGEAFGFEQPVWLMEVEVV